MVIIKIAKEFSDAPGGRFKKEGNASGEEFRDSLLEPRYLEALKNNEKLIVDLDGGYGYYISFLEESFGGLARKYSSDVLSRIEIISRDEPSLEDKIKQYMKNDNTKKT